MGVRRTYHQADLKFRTAKDIASHVLKYLYDASIKKQNGTVSKTVITVPASFQPAQKQDTMDAASIAGITLDDGCLLDEPIAALLGYLSFRKKRIFDEIDTPKNLLVFDFGGGTCDIAIFKLLNSKSAQPISISPLSVSRYLRLGGGDIDNAIVLKVLLPQLLKQNELNEFDLNYQQKRDYVIPSLLGVAESLKIAICNEIYRLKQFGIWNEKRETLYHELPSAYSCDVPKYSELVLKNPRLSAIEFEEILKPFTDVDILYPIQDEYSITSSIFSPIQDALERCNLAPEEIDFCLLAGGSSLIPMVEEILNQYFNKGSLLRFNDPDQLQTSVAVGASLQALSLSIFNRRLVQPVSSDDISIRTKGGTINLVQRGTPLPYPSDGSWASDESLKTPQSEILRVELENSRKEILLQGSWKITPSVNKGKPLLLKYRMDGNHLIHLSMSLKNDSKSDEYTKTTEYPINVVNPNAKQDEILELEESIRTKNLDPYEKRKVTANIAKLERELGRYEKARDLFIALNNKEPCAFNSFQIGFTCGELGDYEREEKFYKEAARLNSDGSSALFNLALSQSNQNKYEESLKTINKAIHRSSRGPDLVLKARIMRNLGKDESNIQSTLTLAFEAFGNNLRDLDDWSLSWFAHGANLADDKARLAEHRKEREKRKNGPNEGDKGHFPPEGDWPEEIMSE